jgi:dihydrofolate reductase
MAPKGESSGISHETEEIIRATCIIHKGQAAKHIVFHFNKPLSATLVIVATGVASLVYSKLESGKHSKHVTIVGGDKLYEIILDRRLHRLVQ